MSDHLSPLQKERNELGYSLQLVREGRMLRVVHKPCKDSDVCVFFVHGGGGRAGQFKHLIKKLENLVNVVAFDFLGHGESPHINNSSLYTADEHLQDLIAVFNKYKQHRNVYVSHSYGNIHMLRHLKMLMVRGKLDSIAGVVMIGLGANAPVSGGLIVKLPTFVLEWLRPLARSASNATLFSSNVDPALIRFENSISDHNRMYTMKTLGRDASSQASWDAWLDEGRQVLAGRNIPCILISGDEDGVFCLESAEKLRRRFEMPKEAHHVLEGVGHIPMLEQGEKVGQILMDFLLKSSGTLRVVKKESSKELSISNPDQSSPASKI